MIVFRPWYFSSFWAARIPWAWRFFRLLFSNSAMLERVVAIKRLIPGSSECGRSREINSIFRLKRMSCNFKNSRVFRLHQSILVTIKTSPSWSFWLIKVWKMGRFLISLAVEPTSTKMFFSKIPFSINISLI